MRLRRLLIPALLLVACKSSESKPSAAKGTAAATGAGSALPAPDRVAPPVDRGSAAPPPSVPPAPPPKTATAQDCSEIVTYFGSGFFEVADLYKVPSAGREGAKTALEAAFGAGCTKDAWPLALIDCMGKQPNEKFTYQRCIERLPAAQRLIWDTKLSAIVEQAGGPAVPSVVAGKAPAGQAFEELCAEFVAEMARFDTCTAAGAYMPALEAVYAERRKAEVGGVIPQDQVERIGAICTKRAADVRMVLPSACPGVVAQ